jgi:hypothetical protein
VDAAFVADGLAMAADQLDGAVAADGAQNGARVQFAELEIEARNRAGERRQVRHVENRKLHRFGVRRAHEPDGLDPPAADLHHGYVNAVE